MLNYFKGWWLCFKDRYLRHHKLFWRPSHGQMYALKKMKEYCVNNCIPYAHYLYTLERDLERIFKGRRWT